MVQIKTKKGDQERILSCEFAGMTFSGNFSARYTDERRLPEIAADWDRLDEVTVSEVITEATYVGLSRLVSINQDENGRVTVKLAKEEDADE